MAGHSKWANIKRRKGAQDAKRGKIFTKLIKEITISVKEGGSEDPSANARLRLAIQNARGANVPKDTIERAVKKGSSTDTANYFETTYEGYGSNGVAIFVECMTDNLKRTVQDVRAAYTKFGGSLGTNGSLEFIFDRRSVFNFPFPEGLDVEEFELEMIDSGAEDVEIDDNYVTVTADVSDFGAIQKKLDELNITPETAELQRIPNTLVALDDEAFQKVYKLIDVLEDNDDVQKVYHNIDMTESQMEMV
ncbi:YebC/PmpR family DNA-binding transcriptional regulator [Xanthovirga aplysinae]|uniref:YebC/PmpR family DNA-binding transcriptional regulator n=1 Tax=Xanthovirga aplysinae TaxID=2529853 RepID=UPI0012BCF1AF|nr:YebC/PmpR family DNA-binding transcriptional regulator [Xanthovirga aplysinae]MTI31557.1 YebC/PmpR family DNA-binding transcriptional regulator [Xanthovirga aplysinae]